MKARRKKARGLCCSLPSELVWLFKEVLELRHRKKPGSTPELTGYLLCSVSRAQTPSGLKLTARFKSLNTTLPQTLPMEDGCTSFHFWKKPSKTTPPKPRALPTWCTTALLPLANIEVLRREAVFRNPPAHRRLPRLSGDLEETRPTYRLLGQTQIVAYNPLRCTGVTSKSALLE